MSYFKIFILIVFLTVYVSIASGQNFSGKLYSRKDIVIQPPSKDLKEREYLSYSLQWLGIPVGTISLEVKEITKINDKECYHIIGHIFPNRVFSKIYNVDYMVDTYIDTKNFYTYRFEKRKRFNNQLTGIVINFDHNKKEAILQDKVYKSSVSLKLLDFTHDLLSSLYHFRLMDVRRGESYKLKILYGTNYWDISINIDEVAVLEVYRKGSFNVFKAEIKTELSKTLLGEHKIIVYFTADSRRVPLKFLMPSPFGPIRGIIKNIPS